MSDHNSPITIICTSWDDFTKKVRGTWGYSGDPTRHTLFRGQRDESWPLASQWDRVVALAETSLRKRPEFANQQSTYLNARREYLDRFRDALIAAPAFSAREFGGDDDWWALGRHHGLITPLLDWTESPYIAAFFAAYDFANTYGNFEQVNVFSGTGSITIGSPTTTDAAHWGKPIVVHMLVVTKEVKDQNYIHFFRSTADSAYRMRAQAGWFSMLNTFEFTSLEAWLGANKLGNRHVRFIIPSPYVSRALSDLVKMNISPKTLFPDVQGAAEFANLGYKIAAHSPFICFGQDGVDALKGRFGTNLTKQILGDLYHGHRWQVE